MPSPQATILSLSIAAAAIFAYFVFLQESELVAIEREVEALRTSPSHPASSALCVERTDPRGLLACSTLHLNIAARDRDRKSRVRHLKLSRAYAVRLSRIRPASGEAAALESLALAGLGLRKESRNALQRSYQQSAYLRDLGAARIAIAARAHPVLDRNSYNAAVAEALWLGRLGRDQRRLVLRSLEATDMFLRVYLKLPSGAGQAPHF